jgi:hypothetical protein
MTLRHLLITLENGQEVEGESHIFSDRVTTNDALPGHIVMTYHVYLPTTHPMFKKLVGLDATMLEELDKEYKTTAFLVEVQRGLVLTREQYDSLDSYEETVINDHSRIDDLYIEIVGYIDDTNSLVECEGTVLANTVKEWIEDHDSSSMSSTWSMLVKSKPFHYAVPHITKMAFIKEWGKI